MSRSCAPRDAGHVKNRAVPGRALHPIGVRSRVTTGRGARKHLVVLQSRRMRDSNSRGLAPNTLSNTAGHRARQSAAGAAARVGDERQGHGGGLYRAGDAGPRGGVTRCSRTGGAGHRSHPPPSGCDRHPAGNGLTESPPGVSGDTGVSSGLENVCLLLAEQLRKLEEPAALPGWITTTTHRECLRVVTAARKSERLGTGLMGGGRAPCLTAGTMRSS